MAPWKNVGNSIPGGGKGRCKDSGLKPHGGHLESRKVSCAAREGGRRE